ncbi:MAG: M28 family peptidase [Candidatus Promineifilaceae bacterium]
MMLSNFIDHWDKAWAVRFPRRLRRKEKEQFLDELEEQLGARNLETTRLNVKYVLSNHILMTECEEPKVILTAHYDTPTIMPFWIGAFFDLIGHTRQISGGILLLILLYVPSIVLLMLDPTNQTTVLIANLYMLLILLSLIPILIPNPHNREDNTSGVIALLTLAEWLKDKPELRKHVQFVFFDNEELGLLGSNGLKRYWDKQNYPYQNAAVINLDCVTRGRIPLIVHHGNDVIARRIKPYLAQHLPETKTFHLRWLPISDNFTFRNIGAVNISLVDPTKIPGGYQIPKIHSPGDNDFGVERMTALVKGLIEFVQDA